MPRILTTRSATVFLILFLLRAAPAGAFCEEAGPYCISNPEVCADLGAPRCHREVTEEGLAFMRPHLLERTVNTNLHMDHQHTTTLWSHADGCDFRTTGHEINSIYSSDVDENCFFENFHCDTWGVTGLLNPSDPRPADAAAVLGYALHPVQDLYSHSNWVEITKGFPNPPLIEATVDLWGTQPWVPIDVPAGLLAMHPGVDAIVLAEENGFENGWVSSEATQQPYHLPTVLTDGPTYLGVISGSTHGSAFQEEECAEHMRATHTNLNKDSPKMTTQYHGVSGADHVAAADLAVRQTAHEWCRILHITQRLYGSEGVSVPIGFWVSPNAAVTGPGSPHPPGSPCATTPSGPVEISVDVDEIKVLDDTDSAADDPGELNFVLVLFTHDLTRSARAERNSITAESGELIGDDDAPGPVSLCLSEEQANAAVATIQAWDDDSGVAGDLNPDGDQALRGVYAEVALNALGVHTITSPSMEVVVDIQHAPTDADEDGLTRCDEEMRGTDPGNADSDADGLPDGAEVEGGTGPLDPDSDDDGILDGADTCPLAANAAQDDLDDDGLGDACDDSDAVLDLRRARVRQSKNAGRPNGEILVTGDIVLGPDGDVFDPTDGVAIEIRDGAGLFEVFAWNGDECQTLGSGRVRCRNATGDFNQLSEPLSATAGHIRFRLSFKRRDITAPFAPDLTMRLVHSPAVQILGIDRVGSIGDCRITSNAMLCHD